jgi:hypothetical protein
LIAERVSTAAMIAGRVTAGKSWGNTDGEEMPTATSQVENGMRDEPQHRGPSRYTVSFVGLKNSTNLF